MIIEKAQYELLDQQIEEWEELAKEQGGIIKSVSNTFKDLVKVLRKSDKLELHEITVVLAFLVTNINQGQEYVQEMCEHLYAAYGIEVKGMQRPGIGETAMKNPDGSFVTLKELGIDD